MRWLLLIALAACQPGFENSSFPHKRAAGGIDPAWLPHITITRGSYVEQACNPKPVEDTMRPCAMAITPRSNEPVDCMSTFVFQQILGCCLPYFGVATPTIIDRVLFFECPD